MAKRGDTNGRSDAHGVVLAMKLDDLIGGIGVLGEAIDDRRPILDELARRDLAAVDQVAGTIAGQIKSLRCVSNRLSDLGG